MVDASSRPRTRLAVDERRAQLLELGRELFNSKPYDAIAVDDIAQAAGISKGLLYHYFSSKRRFYVETVRASIEELSRVTEPDRSLPPDQQLETTLTAYLDYVERNGVGFENLLRSGVGADPEIAAMIEGQRQLAADRVLEGLGLTSAPPGIRVAVRGWVGFIDASCMDWIRNDQDVDRETMIALLVNSLQSALLTAVQMDEDLRGVMPTSTSGDVAMKIAMAVADSTR